MQLVSSRDEVKRNLETLESYRVSRRLEERAFYHRLIRKGICFLIYREGDRLLIGPSRFIGYVDNDMPQHEANEDKDGRETNPAIEAIFGRFELSNEGESVYRQICNRNGIPVRSRGAFGQPRKYVIYTGVALRGGGLQAGISGRLPEEVVETATLVEGAVRQITVNAYERNPEARQRCIEAHGTSCCVCGFSFGAVYGEVADGYIHVHHLRPLSEVSGEYVVDPVADLRPVCPNCHAVLHLGGQCRSIEEVRQLMERSRRNRLRSRRRGTSAFRGS